MKVVPVFDLVCTIKPIYMVVLSAVSAQFWHPKMLAGPP